MSSLAIPRHLHRNCTFLSLTHDYAFPQAHLVEEEILSRATGFGADEVLHLPPRLPGQGLHQSLIDVAHAQDEASKRAERREARARAREERAAAAAASAAATQDDATEKSVKPAGGGGGGASTSGGKPVGRSSTTAAAGGRGRQSMTNDAMEGARMDGGLSDDEADGEDNEDGGAIDGVKGSPAAAAAAYGDEPWLEPLPAAAGDGGGGADGDGTSVIPEWDRVSTAREEGRAHDVVVTGPPLSGKSTLSRALAARYRTPALTVDGIINEAMRLRNKLGARVRAAIHWFTAKEEVRQDRGNSVVVCCSVFNLYWLTCVSYK